ncbi:hypothetical protein ACFLX1_01145 [Chloroflexota bacterium]
MVAFAVNRVRTFTPEWRREFVIIAQLAQELEAVEETSRRWERFETRIEVGITI